MCLVGPTFCMIVSEKLYVAVLHMCKPEEGLNESQLGHVEGYPIRPLAR